MIFGFVSGLVAANAGEWYIHKYLLHEDAKQKDISAYIKKSNEASLKSFVNAGFAVIDENMYFGELSYKLIKHSNE